METIETHACAAGCGWRYATHYGWKRMTESQRAAMTEEKVRRGGALGMCNACYERDRRGGDGPAGATRPAVPGELVLIDWNWLHEAGELSRSDPMAARIRAAAPRIGVTPRALEKALDRAGVAA